MRVVLDTNVYVSALLTAAGPPAEVVNAWLDGEFEALVSPNLLKELSRVLAYPRVRKRVSAEDAAELLELLQNEATVHPDPSDAPPIRSGDPHDDYLIALAAWAEAVIVSGDQHLLDLAKRIPVYSPAKFLEELSRR